jgi:hypothetical protein
MAVTLDDIRREMTRRQRAQRAHRLEADPGPGDASEVARRDQGWRQGVASPREAWTAVGAMRKRQGAAPVTFERFQQAYGAGGAADSRQREIEAIERELAQVNAELSRMGVQAGSEQLGQGLQGPAQPPAEPLAQPHSKRQGVTLQDVRREMDRRGMTPKGTGSEPAVSTEQLKEILARKRQQAAESARPASQTPDSPGIVDYLMMGAFGPVGGPAVKEFVQDPAAAGKALTETAGGAPLVVGGETIGRVAGAPFGPPGVIIGGGIGAGAGEMGRQVLAGEDLNFKKALIEGGAQSIGLKP